MRHFLWEVLFDSLEIPAHLSQQCSRKWYLLVCQEFALRMESAPICFINILSSFIPQRLQLNPKSIAQPSRKLPLSSNRVCPWLPPTLLASSPPLSSSYPDGPPELLEGRNTLFRSVFPRLTTLLGTVSNSGCSVVMVSSGKSLSWQVT